MKQFRSIIHSPQDSCRPRAIGRLTLTVAGRSVVVQGGPFEACPPDAYGVCLEAQAKNAASAAQLVPVGDFGVPAPGQFHAAIQQLIAAMIAAPERLYFVGCRAGLGRTGTFIACLAKASGNVESMDSVEWVRKRYAPGAVETPEQEAFVRNFSAIEGSE